MNITFQDPTGDCSFSGQWDGQNYDFNVETLNIMAKQYNAYEVAENLPKELQRAINESKELTRLTKLLPYLSCETPVTFGGKEPPLTCNATTAKELADVIVNWLVDKVRFSLILAWPQAEKNRAAAEAAELAWLPQPLPFGGRIHAPGVENTTQVRLLGQRMERDEGPLSNERYRRPADEQIPDWLQKLLEIKEFEIVDQDSGKTYNLLDYLNNPAYADISQMSATDMVITYLPLLSYREAMTHPEGSADRRGWLHLAEALRKYLAEDAFRLIGDPRIPFKYHPGTQDPLYVEYEWVMEYSRTRSAVQRLMQPEYLYSEAAVSTNFKRLSELGLLPEQGELSFNFFTPDIRTLAGAEEIRRNAMQAWASSDHFFTAINPFHGPKASRGTTDGFRALFGKAGPFFVPSGRIITNLDSSFTIILERGTIIYYDAFDFGNDEQDDQPLGWWDDNGMIALAGIELHDSDFRNHAERTGMGNEYRIVSKSIEFELPDIYAYRYKDGQIFKPELELKDALENLYRLGLQHQEVQNNFKQLDDNYPIEIWTTALKILDDGSKDAFGHYVRNMQPEDLHNLINLRGYHSILEGII